MLRLFKNKIFIGGLCLLTAGALAFLLLPRLYEAKSATTEVVQLRETAPPGTVITENMLTVTEVGSYGLPNNVIKDKTEVIGLVAADTVYAGEELRRERFMTEDDYKKSKAGSGDGLSEGNYLLTIGLPSEASGLAGVLRAGDTVDVYGYTGDGDGISINQALTSIKVYEVMNSKLVSLDDLDAKLKDDSNAKASDYDFAPAYVVLVVDEQQAKVLIGLEKDKSLHLTLRKAGA